MLRNTDRGRFVYVKIIYYTDNFLPSSDDRCQRWNHDRRDDHGRRIGFHQQVREQREQLQRQSIPTSF